MDVTAATQFLGDRYSQHMVAYPAPFTKEPLPISDLFTQKNILYVHIPFCTGKCTYCSYTTKTTNNFSEIDVYLSYLEDEAILLSRHGSLKISSIYIGGGTPTMLTIFQLATLLHILNKYFDLSNLEEFSLEGCPETFSKEKAKFVFEQGVNRASIGVESFDDETLKKMNRRHKARDSIIAINDIQSVGLDLDIDVITCYPGYTKNKIHKDLETIKNYKPVSVSTYKYTVKPKSVDFKHHDSLLSNEEVLEQLFLWYQGLQDIGYHQRNVDWFFIDEHKRFIHQEYKLDCKSNHIVLGVSGYGIIGDTQYYNTKSILKYYSNLKNKTLPIRKKQKLSKEALIKRKLMFGIRDSISSNFKFPEPEKIELLLNEKLLLLMDNKYKLSTLGQLYTNEIQEYLAT